MRGSLARSRPSAHACCHADAYVVSMGRVTTHPMTGASNVWPQIRRPTRAGDPRRDLGPGVEPHLAVDVGHVPRRGGGGDRKSTRLNSSHVSTSYAVFCL